MKVLGLGHSHIVAIARGCYDLQHAGATIAGQAFTSSFHYLFAPELTPTLVQEEGPPRLNPRLAELITQENAAFGLLAIGGNEHIALSIAQGREPVDFILGENPELPLAARAAILSEAAVRETLRERMAETLGVLAALRRATSIPLFCLEPPPPLPDVRVLAYPKEFFRKAVDSRKLSPELFRHKIWRVQGALYRAACARENIEFVGVPESFVTSQGVLAEDAWGADASHANQSFGAAMVVKAIGLMEARLAAAKT